MQKHTETQHRKISDVFMVEKCVYSKVFVYIFNSIFPSDAVAFLVVDVYTFFFLSSLRVVYCFGHTFTSDCY